MQVTFISSDGAGFAQKVDITGEINIKEFFNYHMEDRNYGDYRIRVNRLTVTEDYVLQDGDTITITPVKVAGASKQVTFISSDGAGFAEKVDIGNDDTTIQEFFNYHMEDRNYGDYRIRVNRLTVTEDYVLQDGDTITITPVKVAGA